MWNAWLVESQAGIKTEGKRYHANDRKWRGTKEPLDRVKEESEKVGLEHTIQKTKIIASNPITFWQIDGETMETVTDFIFGGSKITADVDCSHKIKRHLLLGKKAMTNLDSILKSIDITLLTKFYLVKINNFSSSHVWVWQFGTQRKLNAKELMPLNCGVAEDSRVPWTARDRISQT